MQYRDLLRAGLTNVAMQLNRTGRTAGFGARDSTDVLCTSRNGWDLQRVARSYWQLTATEATFCSLESEIGHELVPQMSPIATPVTADEGAVSAAKTLVRTKERSRRFGRSACNLKLHRVQTRRPPKLNLRLPQGNVVTCWTRMKCHATGRARFMFPRNPNLTNQGPESRNQASATPAAHRTQSVILSKRAGCLDGAPQSVPGGNYFVHEA